MQHSLAARTRPNSFRIVGILLAVAGIIAFSMKSIFIKLAYGYVTDPVTLLALRMLFSLPFFLAASVWMGRGGAGRRLTPGDVAAIALLGLLGYYLASFLDFLGLQYVDAGFSRLILYLYPTLVVLLSALFLKKPIGRRDAAALALCYAGVAVVLSQALRSAGANLPLGIAFVFGSAISYAIYLVAGGQVIRRVGAMRFAAHATTVACILCILQFLVMRPLSALALPIEVYGLALAIALISTVGPVFMTAEALRRIGANDVAMIGALGPVSVIALGWIWLDERLTLVQIGGATLVLVGVVLVSLRPGSHTGTDDKPAQ